jgi:hypothetical protein
MELAKIKDGMCGLDLPQRTNIKSQDQPTRYATFIFPQAQKPHILEKRINKIKIMQESEL